MLIILIGLLITGWVVKSTLLCFIAGFYALMGLITWHTAARQQPPQ